MENSVEALKLAGGVLIFVIAISITISSFNNVTQAINRIFNYEQDEEYVKDFEGNYLNFINFDIDNGTREVGIDTIIPMIYRAYRENFAIYFYQSNGEPLVLYKSAKGEDINYIDLEKEVHANSTAVAEHIKELLDDNGLYNKFKDEKFIERLGEYYMDDVNVETDISEVNKVKKRVVVYQQQ